MCASLYVCTPPNTRPRRTSLGSLRVANTAKSATGVYWSAVRSVALCALARSGAMIARACVYNHKCACPKVCVGQENVLPAEETSHCKPVSRHMRVRARTHQRNRTRACALVHARMHRSFESAVGSPQANNALDYPVASLRMLESTSKYNCVSV